MDKSDAERRCSAEEGSQLNRNRSFKSKQLVRSQALRESQSPPRTLSPAAITTDNIHDTVAKNNVTTVNNNVTAANNNGTTANNNVTAAKHNGTTANNNVTAAKNNGTTTKSNNNTVRNNVNVSETVSTAETIDKSNISNVKLDEKVTNVRDRSGNVQSSQEIDNEINCNSVSVGNDDNNKAKQQVEIQITPGACEDEDQPSEQRMRARRWLGHKHHSGSNDLLSNNPRATCVCGSCGHCPHCRGRRRRPRCPTKQDSGIACSEECADCSDTEHTGTVSVVANTSSMDDEHTHYCRCPERKERPKSISITRTDSDDKCEPTGVDLVNFIKETLNKNGRDRVTLLRIEKELHALINDTGRCVVRFPVMSSYGRMLVHRCAALFQLSHHLDTNVKNSVLVSKSGTSGGRIPCTDFKQWCTTNFPPSPQRRTPDHINAKSILKRDAHSLDEPGAGLASAVRSKSLEQREKDYERVRKKIFNSDTGSCDESDWLTGPVKLLTADAARNKLLKVHSLETNSGTSWSGSQQWDRRGAVAKSHSFGGYGQPEPPRLLSRQGDLASSSWRLSPSSSGYRTLSLHSADSVTPSPTGGASPEPSGGTQGAVVWAVTDIACVPVGAVVIHPQTGRPLTNPDGSVYHFDPNNPPVLYDADYARNEIQQREQQNDKRRGRLEKQHSFIDTECECLPTNGNHTKCCCNCRQATNKTRTDNKPTITPTSPSKNRYETSTPTNQNSSNHRQPYSANEKEETYESYSNTTNHLQEPSVSLKQFESTNGRQERTFESTNQRHESQKSYDRYESHKYAPTNQKASFESSHQRSSKLTNQDSQEYGTHYYGNYPHNYRQDEMTSPPQVQAVQYMQPELSMVQNLQAKMTPVPVATPDPNIRPMSLTNLIYPGVQPYQYQMRVEAPLHVYQQPMPAVEEPKAPPDATGHTFTIDPSYPYAPVDYSQCGACTSCSDHNVQTQQSYTAPYATEPQPQLSYPVANVMIPHAQSALPFPYQEQLQWPIQFPVQPMGQIPLPVPIQNPALGQSGPKLLEVYPMVHPSIMPHGAVSYVYPQTQVLSQPYQLCQPIYPMMDSQRRSSVSSQRNNRNSTSGSSRTTPLQTPPDDKRPHDNPTVPYSHHRDNATPTREATGVNYTPMNVTRHNSNDIAVKIQQIKEQMSQLNTGNKSGNNPTGGKPDWKRRNSGNGILGSYPTTGYNGRVLQPATDDSQLSTAARAIVNSIRSMQAKGNNNQDNRPEQKQSNQYYQHNSQNQNPHQYYQHNNTNTNQVQHPNQYQHNQRRRRQDENRNSFDGNDQMRSHATAVPFQYRPPYLLRQMSPGSWCRGSPGPVHPVLTPPRRPYPDARNPRR